MAARAAGLQAIDGPIWQYGIRKGCGGASIMCACSDLMASGRCIPTRLRSSARLSLRGPTSLRARARGRGPRGGRGHRIGGPRGRDDRRGEPQAGGAGRRPRARGGAVERSRGGRGMSPRESSATTVGGPWFEDLERGQRFEAPAFSVTEGHAALHQAICGDRLRLALDAPLCSAVTGRDAPLVHPNLVCDVSIGQSTGPTQRVLGNLFYRGLVLERQVHIGDTLRTSTEVVALKENRRKPGGRATGLVLLRMRTVDQEDRPVLDYWRCPMPAASRGTGQADDFSDVPGRSTRCGSSAPRRPTGGSTRCARAAGPCFADLSPGLEFSVEAGETVSAGPELAVPSTLRWRTRIRRAAPAGAGSSTADTISVAAARDSRNRGDRHDRRLGASRPSGRRFRGRRAAHRAKRRADNPARHGRRAGQPEGGRLGRARRLRRAGARTRLGLRGPGGLTWEARWAASSRACGSSKAPRS